MNPLRGIRAMIYKEALHAVRDRMALVFALDRKSVV